ncbi:hypothetical protein [Roseinatronobacter ekhonensis]|uniref:hypothetical protein n=1 Tax=Roseinatronobacter ekhonensis TaxID=254356 RepID=UPI0011C36E78|nr:hypothetical protein [Roseibaca ekhonensis]
MARGTRFFDLGWVPTGLIALCNRAEGKSRTVFAAFARETSFQADRAKNFFGEIILEIHVKRFDKRASLWLHPKKVFWSKG